MTAGDELPPVLAWLLAERPAEMTRFTPLAGTGDRPPRFLISLAPWAVATAQELREQFGDDVELTVGILPYPPGQRPFRRPVREQVPETLDPSAVTVALDGPAVVRTGRTLRHALLLRNRTASEIQVSTNGQVTSDVVDPATGEVVGGFAGSQTMPYVPFPVAPGAERTIPLLTGTASFVPRLGYALPPGEWGIQATLSFRESSWRTPVLPLTVTVLRVRS